jgi:5-methylthioadenosine/S-adenosylhomocysteine deaminase
MSILLKGVLLNNEERDVFIEDNVISRIGKNLRRKANKIINGKNKAVIPSFVNGHSHAAMTIFRGYADDMALNKWLRDKIWPLESKLTEEDVYWGAKLACLEMIKSGTTFFNDMYWHPMGTLLAVKEMGIRANIGGVIIDFNNKKKAEKQIISIDNLISKGKKYLNNRTNFVLSPHSIYTVSKESLEWIKDFSKKNDLPVHMHISETSLEVKNCLIKFKKRPLEYLEEINFLSNRLTLAHAIWLNQREMDICKKYNIGIVYNPISNLKLVSGTGFPYKEYVERKIKLAFGTDGCASSNNLDMLEVMKMACLIQKSHFKNPKILSAQSSFNIATRGGSNVFNLKIGKIKEGFCADMLLIDINLPELNPLHNLKSNLVYSANASCVDTVICDGKIIMEKRKVKGEEEIIKQFNKAVARLLKRI